ncbi:MAG: peptidoglycan endopeptidase [Proteobacteria bacterium]|nr:peptidoglycan endopeptidase [Pseudomonadota bacterium]
MRRCIVIIISVLFLLITASNNAFSAPAANNVKQKDTQITTTKNQTSVEKSRNLSSAKSKKVKISKRTSKKHIKIAYKTRKEVNDNRLNEFEITENDGEFTEYKTKKGDTIEKIAIMFNVDKNDILEANNLKDKKLSPKKVILIPKITEEEKDDEFITLTNKPLKPWKSSEEKYMLVKVAKSFVGAPYKYGGESVKGLDCSAYVKKIYDIFDVQLPRSARDQFKTGWKISKDNLAIGDLVFFKTKRYAKYPTHVGIFIGDGNFIHSSSGHNRLGVKIDSLSSDFYSRTYIGATRVKQTSDENAETTKTFENASNNS